MKEYLFTFSITIMFLYISGLKISFKPFSISFTSGWLALGCVCFVAGLICMRMQYYGDGLNRGKELIKEVMEEIKKEQIKGKA